MRVQHPRLLFVEGKEDLRVIPELMGRFIPWGERKEPQNWPVFIKEFDGINNLLEEGVIEAGMKSPGLQALGVMIDANSNPAGRWKSIRDRAISAMPDIPENLPRNGLVMENKKRLRFGVWLMPDCLNRGMLETFLASFVDTVSQSLWKCVEAHCADAKANYQAPYNSAHADKANVHAWLALQDPPGQQLHSAIMQNILKPNSPYADAFVSWFKLLYGI